MLYVETFGNPERFARIAQRVSRRKPILAVKGRRAPDGGRGEAQTHTAALRREDVVDALLHHAGILRFTSGEELFNAAEFVEAQPLPGGRRVGIVSNSTGRRRSAGGPRGHLRRRGGSRSPWWRPSSPPMAAFRPADPRAFPTSCSRSPVPPCWRVAPSGEHGSPGHSASAPRYDDLDPAAR